MNRSLNAGAAFRCTTTGNIIEILHNNLDFLVAPFPMMPVSNLADVNDLSKWLNFVVETKQNGACYGWSVNFLMKEGVVSLHIGAVMVDDELLLVVASNRDTADRFLDEMIRINNEQTNLIRASAKQTIQSRSIPPISDDLQFEQLSRLNNELVNMQRELAKKNAELAKLNELKNYFLGMAAHDLRNPIGAVLNFAELVLDDQESLSETHLFCIQHIRKTAGFMLDMVNDLLDLSYIESGKMVLKTKLFDMVELINKCLIINGVFAGNKSIEISFHCEMTSVELLADESKIEQVLNNLLSNAIKYSFPSSKIEVVLLVKTNQMVLEVRDFGQGIPESFLPKLFHPFEKSGKKTTGGEKSTGIGLSIVRKIVEAHQGKVWAVSKEGIGSSFFISLPLPAC